MTSSSYMDLREKVLSGLCWSAGVRFMGQLITWAITIIVMRLLTPEDYGLMAMAGVFISFLALLNELGLGAAMIQKQKVDETSLRQTFGLLLISNSCLFLLLLLIAPLIGYFFHEERVVAIIRLLSAQFIMMPFGIIPQSLLAREMNFKKISVVEFVSAIAGSLITLMLALNGFGVWSLVWGSMTIILLRTVGLNFVCPYLHGPRFSLKGMRHTISFGSYVTLVRALWFFFLQADVFIVGRIMGKELLGFYSVAMNLATLPMQKVSGIINQVAFPAFSSIQAEPLRVASHSLKAVRIMSFFAFPLLWGISCIAPEIVSVVLGNKWHQAIVPLQLVSLIVPFRMIINLLDPAVMGLGRPDVTFSIVLFNSIVMPLAILIGTRWGLLGVSLAWVLVFPPVLLRNLYRLVSVLEIELSDVLSAMARPLLATSIMYAAVMGMKMVLGPGTESINHLLLLIITGVIVYGGMIVYLCKEVFREVLGLIRL